MEIQAGGLHGEGEHRFDSHLVFTEKIFKESLKVHTFEVVALLFTAPITCLFCSMAYQLETRLVIQSFLTVSCKLYATTLVDVEA